MINPFRTLLLFTGMTLLLSGCVEPGNRLSTYFDLPSDFSLKLGRTECFGSCPVYSISVDRYGHITYKGEKDVRVIGTRHWRLIPHQQQGLVENIESSKFMSLENIYKNGGIGCGFSSTDSPSATIEVTMNGKHNKIELYEGCMTCSEWLEEMKDRVQHHKYEPDPALCKPSESLPVLRDLANSVDHWTGANYFTGHGAA